MRKTSSMMKVLGVITLGFTGALIAALVLAAAGGGTWWYVNSLKKEKASLTEKVGELKVKVETLEASNLELSRTVDFQKQITRTSMDVSEEHVKDQAEVRDAAQSFKENLTKQTVVITKPVPISKEQQRNSQARIGTLWASYCDASKDVKRCVDKHIKPAKPTPGNQTLSSLDWLFVPYADQLSTLIQEQGAPLGLIDLRHEVKEAQHA